MDAAVACPVCGQGLVVWAKTKRDGDELWLCDECDVIWKTTFDPRRDPDDTLESFLDAKGLSVSWTELEVRFFAIRSLPPQAIVESGAQPNVERRARSASSSRSLRCGAS